MREPPKLAESRIQEALEANYPISVESIRFIPLGADAFSAAFAVQAEGGPRFFLKVRSGEGFGARSLAVPRGLSDWGVPHILAPLPTSAQALWLSVDGFALSLFPFIEGRRAADVGLSKAQWVELGKTVREIHASRLTPETLKVVPREEFVPTRRDLLTGLQALLDGDAAGDEVRKELSAFWMSRRAVIGPLVDRCDSLGRQLRAASPRFVLCHADLHNWNVLVDPSQELWIVDWDETILAPKERDLMFVVGGIGPGLVRPEETACFLQGYGEAAINPLALTYYRYAWALQDMAAYAEQVLRKKDWSEISRREALERLIELFGPGQIIEIALASEAEGKREA